MKDDTFELLSKMYADLTKRLDSLEGGQNELKSEQQQITQCLTKIETTLEHDIKDKLQSLHERAAANTDKLDNNTQRLDTIENKLDYMVLSVNSQDKRLEVVESSKRRKAK